MIHPGKFLAGVCLLLCIHSVKGQVTVMKLDSTHIELKSAAKVKQYISKHWTVNSAEYRQHCDIFIQRGRFNKLRNVELLVYDNQGVDIEHFAKSDFVEFSTSSGLEVGDNSGYYLSYAPRSFPVTFTLRYETTSTDLLGIPGWQAIKERDMQVQRAIFVVDHPSELPLRHHSYQLSFMADSLANGISRMKWENPTELAPVSGEDHSQPLYRQSPWVQLSPIKFKVDNFEGSTASWSAFAAWNARLLEGRGELSPETVLFLQEEFGAIKSPVERAKAVYEWMQSRSRYVSIQLGIGGWQPAPAAEVDEFGYGDCKALSNFTRAALAAVGIEAHYSLVYSSPLEDRVDPSFPSASFNHVILQLPLSGDTAWLECTSRITPFDFTPESTAGHYALVITDGGGYLTRIRDDHQKKFTTQEVGVLTLTEDGQASLESDIIFSDLAFGSYLTFFSQSTIEKERREWMTQRLNSPKPLINHQQHEINKEGRHIKLHSKSTLPDYARSMGNLMTFSTLPTLSKLPELAHHPQRSTPITLKRHLKESIELTIELPKGYKLDYLPEDVSLKNSYGNLRMSYVQDGEQLRVSYEAELKSGEYPAKDYDALRNFLIELQQFRNRKIVLIKS